MEVLSYFRENPALAQDLGNMGITHHFATLLQTQDDQLRQQVLEALLYVLENSPVARKEARLPQLDLSGTIGNLRTNLTDFDQYQEELSHMDKIEQLLDSEA